MDRTTKRWHLRRRGHLSDDEFVLSFLEETAPNDAIDQYSSLPDEVQDTILEVLQSRPVDDWSKIAWCGVVFAYDPDAEDDDVIRERNVVVGKLILDNHH